MIERFAARRAFIRMEPRDLLVYRTPLVGALVALAIGVTGGLVLRTGPQVGPAPESYPTRSSPYAQAEPVAWPSGRVPDYVVGTDFLQAQQAYQPVVVASEPIAEYVPPAEPEPAPESPPTRVVEVEPGGPSMQADILDPRPPEEPPAAPRAPVAVDAPVALAITD